MDGTARPYDQMDSDWRPALRKEILPETRDGAESAMA